MAYFWERARAGELVQQYCAACQTYLSPPAYDCLECHSGPEQIIWRGVSGRGTVHTFNVYHRPYHPGFEEDLPYNTAIVELEEGPMVAARITGCDNSEITVGMPVTVTFVDHNGDPELLIPMFMPDRR
jgi:uncharacterized OB-fold protein